MNNQVDAVILAVYALSMWAIGIWYGRRWERIAWRKWFQSDGPREAWFYKNEEIIAARFDERRRLLADSHRCRGCSRRLEELSDHALNHDDLDFVDKVRSALEESQR